jgi:hypothetical protein
MLSFTHISLICLLPSVTPAALSAHPPLSAPGYPLCGAGCRLPALPSLAGAAAGRARAAAALPPSAPPCLGRAGRPCADTPAGAAAREGRGRGRRGAGADQRARWRSGQGREPPRSDPSWSPPPPRRGAARVPTQCRRSPCGGCRGGRAPRRGRAGCSGRAFPSPSAPATAFASSTGAAVGTREARPARGERRRGKPGLLEKERCGAPDPDPPSSARSSREGHGCWSSAAASPSGAEEEGPPAAAGGRGARRPSLPAEGGRCRGAPCLRGEGGEYAG